MSSHQLELTTSLTSSWSHRGGGGGGRAHCGGRGDRCDLSGYDLGGRSSLGGGRLWTADSDIPSLDDADAAEEGEEVEELRDDAVVEVTTPALTVTDGRTGLEGSVGLVQTEREEFVLHVVLRDSGRGSKDAGGQGGQGPILYPGNLVDVSVGGGAHYSHINIRLAAVGTMAPLALTSHVFPFTVSQGGAPGDPVVSVHQSAAIVLLILEDERKHAGNPGGSAAHSDAALGRYWIHRSNLNVDPALHGTADPPSVGSPAADGILQPAVRSALPASLASIAEVLTARGVPAQSLTLRHGAHLAGVGNPPQVSARVVGAHLPAVTAAGPPQSSPYTHLTCSASITVLAGVSSLARLIIHLQFHPVRSNPHFSVIQYLTKQVPSNLEGINSLVFVGVLLVVVISCRSHGTEQLAQIESNCKVKF